MPYELIIVDDGSEQDVIDYIMELKKNGHVSNVILNCGKNMGVGESVRRGFDIAKGNYLVKSDQDLVYKPDWDKKCVRILSENTDKVEMVGCFKYQGGHPEADFDKSNPVNKGYYYIVDDFVSSMFMIRGYFYGFFGKFPIGSTAFAEDVKYKNDMKAKGFKLALTKRDCAINQGFGLGKSTLFTPTSTENDIKTVKIHNKPKIFKGKE